MDLLGLYNKVISTKEYNDFINLINGKIVSSPIQQKRCTIQIFSQEEGIWVFYANGTVRTNLGSDRLGKVSNPPENWPKIPNVDDMVSLLVTAYKRINKRKSNKESKYERINNNKEHQIILLYILFDPSYVKNLWYDGQWRNIDKHTITTISRLSFEEFIKRYGTTDIPKKYRVIR